MKSIDDRISAADRMIEHWKRKKKELEISKDASKGLTIVDPGRLSFEEEMGVTPPFRVDLAQDKENPLSKIYYRILVGLLYFLVAILAPAVIDWVFYQWLKGS